MVYFGTSLDPIEVVRRWREGCGNTIPLGLGPWRCGPCSRAALRAFLASFLTPWRWFR